jgi:copper chaperone CopZ
VWRVRQELPGGGGLGSIRCRLRLCNLEKLVSTQEARRWGESRLLLRNAKGSTMERKTLSVPTITCGHCVMTIKRELGEVKGVSRVEGDPGAKTITVEWDAPATLEAIKSNLREINYPAAD